MNGAPGLMELDAARLEVESAKIENPAHVALVVVDEVLMPDLQYLAGPGLVPVRHQINIHAVVAADVIDAVGKLLPRGEQLLQVAEAARHRFAPCIDDLGVRQHQMDEAE